MVLSVRAQRSRADDMDHSPAIDQHSYTQPPIPTAPAPRAPASGLPSPFHFGVIHHHPTSPHRMSEEAGGSTKSGILRRTCGSSSIDHDRRRKTTSLACQRERGIRHSH